MADVDESIDNAINAAIEETGEPVADTPSDTPIPVETKEEPEVEAKIEEKEAAAPEPEPEKAAEPEPEPENTFKLNANVLEKVNESPELREIYKEMQRGMGDKATSLAEQRKEAKEALELISWMREDPKRALKAWATEQGVDLPDSAKTKTETKVDDIVDQVQKEWAVALNSEEAAQTFTPLLRKTIEGIVKNALEPQEQFRSEVLQRQNNNDLAASLNTFKATVADRGEDMTPEIQQQMADKMASLSPADGIDIQDFLGTVYDSVVAKASRKAGVSAQLKRLQEAKNNSEPVVGTRPTPDKDPTSITMDMTEDEAVNAAVAFAHQQTQ